MKLKLLSTALILTSTLILTPALVAQAKTIDVTQALVGFDGNNIKEPDPKDTTKLIDITLREVIVNSLEASLSEDRGLTGDKKIEYDDLAREVYHNKTVTFTDAQITLIKTRVGEAFSTNVVAAVWRLLGSTPPTQK